VKGVAVAVVASALEILACAGTSSTVNSNSSSTTPSTDTATDPSTATATASGTGTGTGTATATDTSSEEPHALPTACAAGGGDVCTPPSDFVDRLCNRNYADAALSLMAKGTPFTRVFLRGKVEAWYAGGPTTRETLAFDEEVLVLRFRAPAASGIVIEGSAGSYDVMRWNGNCFTLDGSQVTTKRPPRPKAAPLSFYKFGEKMQSALLANDAVRNAYQRRGRECKGATVGEVTLACERADTALSAAIVDFVRSGGTLAPPARLP